MVFYSLFHRLSCKLALKNACTIIHLAFEQALSWDIEVGEGVWVRFRDSPILPTLVTAHFSGLVFAVNNILSHKVCPN